MNEGHVDVSVNINNSPAAVIQYVADCRNRSLFLGPLKSISHIQGEPSAAGTKWKWTWVALGMEFEGTGKCLQHEPGRLYVFKTEGGIASTWTYRAEQSGDGTALTIDVDYEVPTNVVGKLPTSDVAEQMKNTEANRVAENLKVILDRE